MPFDSLRIFSSTAWPSPAASINSVARARPVRQSSPRSAPRNAIASRAFIAGYSPRSSGR